MASNKEEKVQPEEERLSEEENTEEETDADTESDESDEDSEEEDAPEEEKPKAPARRRTASARPASPAKVRAARLQPKPEEDAVEEEDDTDYLRQYQFKKVNDVPTIGGVHTDPDKGSKAEKMKIALLAQPRVRILVPRAPGEHASVLMTVNLNGYRLDFPKNAYVELPEQVANVIMESQKQTDSAIEAFRIDGDDKKSEALN